MDYIKYKIIKLFYLLFFAYGINGFNIYDLSNFT